MAKKGKNNKFGKGKNVVTKMRYICPINAVLWLGTGFFKKHICYHILGPGNFDRVFFAQIMNTEERGSNFPLG